MSYCEATVACVSEEVVIFAEEVGGTENRDDIALAIEQGERPLREARTDPISIVARSSKNYINRRVGFLMSHNHMIDRAGNPFTRFVGIARCAPVEPELEQLASSAVTFSPVL
jgi:hypothetical protein